jgi:M6 family metalloprotease-like protein
VTLGPSPGRGPPLDQGRLTAWCATAVPAPSVACALPPDQLLVKLEAGTAYYLDDDGFASGFDHANMEAIKLAAGREGVRLSDFDLNDDGHLTPDECLIVIVKAQQEPDGFSGGVCARQVPWADLDVDGVTISHVCEVYVAPPHGAEHLALCLEEVLHLAANLADQYPDDGVADPHLFSVDPGRPGQLWLSDAQRRPVHVDPYHRLKWGWLNPQLAVHSGTFTLRCAATTGDALILSSPQLGTDEFFILENRWRGASWDRHRANTWGEGLALWHCVQDAALAEDWARRAVHLRRADPGPDAHGDPQDQLALFDGNDPARSYELSDVSQPQNLRFRNGTASHIRITNISPSGPVMTVEVDLGGQMSDLYISVFDNPECFRSRHWLYTPLPDNRVVVNLTGIIVLRLDGLDGYKGQSSDGWRQDHLNIILGFPTHFFPKNPLMHLKVEQWAPFITLNAIYDQDNAVDAGWAVDDFGINLPVNKTIFDGIALWADLAVRDSDAWLYRIGYDVTVSGVFVPPPAP